jgi:hypothetical protein
MHGSAKNRVQSDRCTKKSLVASMADLAEIMELPINRKASSASVPIPVDVARSMPSAAAS